MRAPLPLTILAVIALAAACGGGPPAATTAGPAATTPAAATTAPAGGTASPGGGGNAADISCNDGGAGAPVSIVDFAYEPATATADDTDTVTWTNNGDADHTVTFTGGPDCGSLGSGDTLSVLFPGPGTYPYFCDFHAQMQGSVTVN